MDTLPQTQRPLDEYALYGWYKVGDAQVKTNTEPQVPLSLWQDMDPSLIDAPIEAVHIADPMTKNEIMMMYKCSKSIRETIDNFHTMLKRRKDTFPIPGWHKWMIATGFLIACNTHWKELQDPQSKKDYEEWYHTIYTPRPGTQNSGYLNLAVSKRIPNIRITDADDMEEEEDEETCERPKKLRK